MQVGVTFIIELEQEPFYRSTICIETVPRYLNVGYKIQVQNLNEVFICGINGLVV